LNKAPDAFRTISEVAEELDLPQHVLRFWESRFPHIKPLKRGGGRRYYRPEDINLLRGIRRLLYSDGYTIRGVQRILREQGVRTVQLVGQGQDVPNLAMLPPDDASNGEGGENGNGVPVSPDFLTPPDSRPQDWRPSDDAEDDSSGPAAHAPALPQNGPIAEAHLTVVPVAGLELERLDHAPIAVSEVAFNQAALSQITAAPGVATAAAVGMPSSPNVAAPDLDRLKRALAELEACRRLLHESIEGGR
jgi:DNA-binding transcriptional MerR regulator